MDNTKDMKKYINYIGILVIGLSLGWVLFGNTPTEETTHDHNSALKTSQLWTCSMHPNIIKSAPGDCPICGMELIPAAATSDGLSADQFKLSENAIALANIQTSIVGTKTLTNENGIQLSGKITANEETNTVQVSYFSGRIEQLNIGFVGETVTKGQLLATVYAPELVKAQQELITSIAIKEAQPELYKAVRNKLKLWKFSEAQIDAIEKSGKVTENVPIYATVSGTVSEKLVEEGSSITKGQILFKIANLNTVWANFDLYENQINAVRLGDAISITAMGVPNTTFKSKVSFIDPTLNSKTRTLSLRSILSNSTQALKPGMFIQGNIATNALATTQALYIPSSAVLWTGKRSVVYLKTNPNDAVFEMRNVQLGPKTGNYYLVTEGLSVGDEVVTNGAFTLDAAAQLQGKQSMMNNTGNQKNTKQEAHLNHPPKNIERTPVSAAFQTKLKTVVSTYMSLKDALVQEDFKSAKEASKTLQNTIAAIDMNAVTGTAHKSWMTLSKDIKTHASAMNNAADIAMLRTHFSGLSIAVISTVETFGINQKVYEQFCPMANQNKGAYWLSFEQNILNPYYGEAMLTCGETRKTIQ